MNHIKTVLHTMKFMFEGNVLINNALKTFYLRERRKEGNVLFNDTFYLWLYGIIHMVKNQSIKIMREEMHCHHMVYSFQLGRKEMFYLTTHSTHFIYGYMARDIW